MKMSKGERKERNRREEENKKNGKKGRILHPAKNRKVGDGTHNFQKDTPAVMWVLNEFKSH